MISVNVLITQKDPNTPFFTLIKHNRRYLLIWAPYDRWLGFQILHNGIFDIGLGISELFEEPSHSTNLGSKFLFQLHFIFQIIDIFDLEKTFYKRYDSVLFNYYYVAVGGKGRPYTIKMT